jgi:hypothetical protein
MPDAPAKSSKRFLDPIDRVFEVLFGLIMVLTVTGSLSIIEAGREDVRTMLIGVLGCNLAWGIIDGVFYLMGRVAENRRGFLTVCSVRKAPDSPRAQRLIADALPPVIASAMRPADLEMIRLRLNELPDMSGHARLCKKDWLGGVSVFLFVFLSTFPVVIPFLFMRNVTLALRVSNLIAIGMLFAAGYAFGRITGRRPWVRGIAMVVLGTVLVALTIALGG